MIMMMNNGYKTRIATLTQVECYKKYERNPLINLLVYVRKNKKNGAKVELNESTVRLNRDFINDLKDALEQAEKDMLTLKREDVVLIE